MSVTNTIHRLPTYLHCQQMYCQDKNDLIIKIFNHSKLTIQRSNPEAGVLDEPNSQLSPVSGVAYRPASLRLYIAGTVPTLPILCSLAGPV